MNIQNNENETALISSVKKGRYDMVKLLSNYGANVSLKDKFGKSALDYGAYYGNMEIFKFLLGLGRG